MTAAIAGPAVHPVRVHPTPRRTERARRAGTCGGHRRRSDERHGWAERRRPPPRTPPGDARASPTAHSPADIDRRLGLPARRAACCCLPPTCLPVYLGLLKI